MFICCGTSATLLMNWNNSGDHISHVHRFRCRGPVAGSRPDESTGSHARSPSDIQQNTCRLWRYRAITIRVPFATSVISFRQISRGHWLVVSSCHELWTYVWTNRLLQFSLTRCASQQHPKMFCRCQGTPLLRQLLSSTGCRSDSGSQSRRSRSTRPHRDTCLLAVILCKL